MLAEFKTPHSTYVITQTKIYQSSPQVIIRFNEITAIKNKECKDLQDGKLSIYTNNKSMIIHYRANQTKFITQLIKEIKEP